MVWGAVAVEVEEMEGGGGVKGRGVDERSARRWEALFAAIFSMPRSSRRERIMSCMSSALNRGCEQKVHGPIPSFTQMIFPQLRQFGAAVRSGCRVARQSQRRAAGFALAEREGFVWTSRARMAESRSARAVEGACIEGPPEILTLVLGAGEEVLDEG